MNPKSVVDFTIQNRGNHKGAGAHRKIPAFWSAVSDYCGKHRGGGGGGWGATPIFNPLDLLTHTTKLI